MNDMNEDPIVGDSPPSARVFFSNSVYDKLKWVAQVVLPAMALFYISIAPLWGLPYQEEVSGTIVAFDLLLGTLLGISHMQYKNSDARFDGAVIVEPDDVEKRTTDIRVSLDPQAVVSKNELTVKVHRK